MMGKKVRWLGFFVSMILSWVTLGTTFAQEGDVVLVWQEKKPWVTWNELKTELGKRVEWRPLAQSASGIRQIADELAWTRLLMEEGKKRGIEQRTGQPLSFDYIYALAVEKELTKGCVAPENEAAAKRYYDEHPEAFMTPVRARLSRIVLPTSVKKGNLPAAMWLQIEATAIAQGVRTFDQTLADAQTLNPTEKMGDLGYVVLEEDVPIINALKSAKAGEMVGPYVDGDRVYLFKILDKQDAKLIPWDLAKNSAARVAQQHCQKTKLKEERQRLYAAYQLRFDEEGFRKVTERRGELPKAEEGPKVKEK